MKTLGVMHMLFIQDMERSINFYEKTFGFIVLQRSDFWTNLDCGKGKIALCAYGNKSELKETTLIIEVDDHLGAVERIKQNGGSVLKIGNPYDGAPVYNVIFIDTENNQVTATETVKGAHH